MGDRIAILRPGGLLAHYDTPEAILAQPADDFVARFVGADRGLKRLSLRTLREVDLLEVPPEPERSDLPRASESTKVRDALSIMLTSGNPMLLVTGDEGSPRGMVTIDLITALLSTTERSAVP